MKRFLSIIMAVVMVIGCMGLFVACGDKTTGDDNKSEGKYANIKFGVITLHDENSTYDKNFIDAVKAVQEELGLSNDQVIIKTGIDESDACTNAAEELVDAGCNLIFADSFGHESYLLNVAKENPDVQFCHATGTNAHTAGVANFHNAFASIYEGRYLAGVAAGMKIKEMIDSKKITEDQAVMGYVGAHPYAEVKSGYTSFFLGAKSVVPSVTMKVMYTGSWYDEAKEKEAATSLIASGCVLISQHADSMGAPTACENAGVPNVSYNGSTKQACPNTFIVSSKINWAPYFKYIIDCMADGKTIDTDSCLGIKDGAVELTEINETAAAPGTKEAVEAAKAKFEAGELKVFDTATFTVDGKKLDSYKADVDSDEKFTPDTEVVSDGYFHESEMRSAPYFDILIDGITEV